MIALVSSLAALAMALATPGGAAGPSDNGPPAPPPSVSDGCRTAMTGPWGLAIEAYKAKDWAGALAKSDTAKVACAKDLRLAGVVASFRAENLLRLQRPAEAVAEIDGAPPVALDHPLWLTNRLILLAALASVKDDARFVAVRDELVRVNEANLTGGDKPYMVKVERIDTAAGPVDVFHNADKKAPPNTIFILSPTAPAMPVSFEVDEGELAGLIGLLGEKGDTGPSDPFGDLNECGMHATIMVKKSVARSYPDLRKQALDALVGDKNAVAPVSGSSFGGDEVDICPGLMAILPGLPRPDSDD